MRKYAVVMVVVDVVLFLLFVLSSFYQGQLFSQTFYTPMHLTKSEWGFVTITVQNFNYYALNGTMTPTSAPITYPNYPFIISYIFMIANIMFTITLLRETRKKQEPNKEPSNF